MIPLSTLAVTTGCSSTAAHVARARAVAARCGVAYVPRKGSLAKTCAEGDVTMLYVVEKQRESLRLPTGERIGVDQGMLTMRLHTGRDHPLIRATAIDNVQRIMDGTLGLAHDALHLASVWNLPILGAEASPVVFSLLESGLEQLGATEGPASVAAQWIEPRLGRSADILRAVEVGSVDVLLLAPMFRSPRNAAPGYPLFRNVAVHDPLDEETLAAARAAGVRRVVLKLDRGEAPADTWKGPLEHQVRGKANVYWLWDL